jgi:ribonuclease BN (tRNA processing enzyme)
MSMWILPLGVGDAFSAQHYSSSLLVHADGHHLLIDCPHPMLKMFKEATAKAGLALGPEALEAVALTHLHADHASGLESLAYFSFFLLQKKLPLLAHPDVLARLWDGHLAAGMEQLLPKVGQPFRRMGRDDYFDVKPLHLEHAVEHGPFRIECRLTIHHIPTTAFRIHAGGRVLGYSADTAFDPTLIEWLSAADLVVHETNYGVHTPYESLAGLPEGLRQKMRLIHMPDDLEREGLAIAPLFEGVRVDV